MPPRYAYWTILIDDKPTAFRAREREELQPTFVQLQGKNTNVTMQWFARGQLWASREAEREDFQTRKHAAAAPRERSAERPEGAERRGSDWRPGGAHKDPRDRFKKKNRPERAWSEKDPATQRDRDKPGYAAKKPAWTPRPSGGGWSKPAGEGKRPWSGKPVDRSGPPRGDRPPARQSSSTSRPSGGGSDRPWQTKPTGPRAQRKPWIPKPSGDAPRGDRPWSNKPAGGAPRGDRPPAHRSSSDSRPGGGGWSGKPQTAAPRERKPWENKPAGGPARKPWDKPAGERKPWSNKPAGGPPRGDRPPAHGSSWTPRPSGGGRDPNRKPFTPRGPRPGGPPANAAPRKRRDDDPDKD